MSNQHDTTELRATIQATRKQESGEWVQQRIENLDRPQMIMIGLVLASVLIHLVFVK